MKSLYDYAEHEYQRLASMKKLFITELDELNEALAIFESHYMEDLDGIKHTDTYRIQALLEDAILHTSRVTKALSEVMGQYSSAILAIEKNDHEMNTGISGASNEHI